MKKKKNDFSMPFSVPLNNVIRTTYKIKTQKNTKHDLCGERKEWVNYIGREYGTKEIQAYTLLGKEGDTVKKSKFEHSNKW